MERVPIRIDNTILLIIISLLITFIAGRDFLLNEGYVYLAENFEGNSLSDYENLDAWNVKLQQFNYADIPKFYLLYPILIISKAFEYIGIDGYKIFQIILLLSPIFIGFLSSFSLNKYLLLKFTKYTNIVFYSAIIGAYIFIVNPWFATNPRNYSFRLDYAVLPLFVLLVIRLLIDKDKKTLLLIPLLIIFFVGYRFLILISLISIIIFIAYILFINTSRLNTIKYITTYVSISVIVILIKFLPVILYDSVSDIRAVTTFDESRINRESMFNIYTTKITEWQAIGFDLTYDDNTHYLFIFITIFAFTSLLYNNYNRNTSIQRFILIFTTFSFVIFILLISKEINVDNFINSAEIGRLLRHARWNIMPLLLALTVLISLSMYNLAAKFHNRLYIYYIVGIVIIITGSISAWPILSGNMNGYWIPSKVPLDYLNINAIMKSSNEGYVIWLPTYDTDSKKEWINAKGIYDHAPPVGNFYRVSSALPSYTTTEHYFFDYYNLIPDLRHVKQDWVYNGTKLAEIYEPLNIQYIVFMNDAKYKPRLEKFFNEEYTRYTLKKFEKQEDMKLIYNGDIIKGFKLEIQPQKIFSAIPILILDKLNTYDALSKFNNKLGIMYGELDEISEQLSAARQIVISDSQELLLLSNKKITIEPSSFTNIVNYKNEWSKGSVDDPTFQNRLSRLNIDWKWQLDYGAGLVYTMAYNATLNVPLNIERSGDYKILIYYFENAKGDKINISIDKKEFTIYTKNKSNNFVFKELDNYWLDEGIHNIKLTNINGFNAISAIIFLPTNKIQEDVTNLISNKTIIHKFDLEINNSPIIINKTLVIYKTGTYRLSLDGQNEFEVYLYNNNYSTKIMLNKNTTHSYPIYLENGIYTLVVKPTFIQDSHTDKLWLYKISNEKEYIDDLFFTKEMATISYNKINPLLYEVNIKVEKPTLLAFAETYDPLWLAIKVDHEDTIQYKPLKLYDVINGYFIDKGEYILRVIYKPQEWFYISNGILLFILLSIFTYLAVVYFKSLSKNSIFKLVITIHRYLNYLIKYIISIIASKL